MNTNMQISKTITGFAVSNPQSDQSQGKENKQLAERVQSAQYPAFKLMSYNVCHPAEVQQKAELFEKFSWSSRKEKVFTLVRDENPDIVCFQEVRNEKGRSAVADIYQGLANCGYDFVTFRNDPEEYSFINVIGYKVSKFALDTINRWWASTTPDHFSDSWLNGWGRVTLMATFYPIKKDSRNITGPDFEADPIHIVNMHNGVKHLHKLNANKVSIQKIEQLVKRGHVFLCADLNTYRGEGDEEEMKPFFEAGFRELSTPLRTAEGIAVSGNFIRFSYDRVPLEQNGKFGPSQLCHIFYRPIGENKITFIFNHYVNAKRYNGKPEAEAKSETELLLGPDGRECRDEFPSDHLPLILQARAMEEVVDSTSRTEEMGKGLSEAIQKVVQASQQQPTQSSQQLIGVEMIHS